MAKPMPLFMRKLRDHSPDAFIRACQRGGRNSHKERRKQTGVATPRVSGKVKRSNSFDVPEHQVACEAQRMAEERNDHICPID